jgi:hypothetical protein
MGVWDYLAMQGSASMVVACSYLFWPLFTEVNGCILLAERYEPRLLDLYLEGKLEVSRYESRVSQLKHSRKIIEEELWRIRDRTAHIERLEHDRDALLSYYSRLVVEWLDELEPEERNRIYRMLGLTVLVHEDNMLEAKWAFAEGLCRDNVTLPPGDCRTAGR